MNLLLFTVKMPSWLATDSIFDGLDSTLYNIEQMWGSHYAAKAYNVLELI